jgi:phosphatidylglycerol:prolipoprotein diacylglycerol transferase
MYPVLVKLGPLTLHSYGVAMGLAVLAAYHLARRRGPASGYDEQILSDILLIGVLSVILGGRLFYVFTRFGEFLESPLEVFAVWHGGLVFYGGFLSGIAGSALYAWRRNLRVLPLLDFLAPYAMLGNGIHRLLGCVSAGCCYGRPTSLPWGITYPAGSAAAEAYRGAALHPTQIYESLFSLGIAALVLFLHKAPSIGQEGRGKEGRRGARRVADPAPVDTRNWADGRLTALTLTLYAAGRFGIEHFRGDAIRGSVGPLSTSQFIGLFAFAGGLLLLLVSKGRRGEGTAQV